MEYTEMQQAAILENSLVSLHSYKHSKYTIAGVNVSPPCMKYIFLTLWQLLQEKKPRIPVVNSSVRLQKIWPSILDKLKIQEDIIIFVWSNLHTHTTEALEFGKRALAWGTFCSCWLQKIVWALCLLSRWTWICSKLQLSSARSMSWS